MKARWNRVSTRIPLPMSVIEFQRLTREQHKVVRLRALHLNRKMSVGASGSHTTVCKQEKCQHPVCMCF